MTELVSAFGFCHHQVSSQELSSPSTSLGESPGRDSHLLVEYILNLLLADAEKRKGEARLQGVRSHSAGLLGKSRMYQAARPRMRGLTCQRSGSLLERRTATRRTDQRTNNVPDKSTPDGCLLWSRNKQIHRPITFPCRAHIQGKEITTTHSVEIKKWNVVSPLKISEVEKYFWPYFVL